MRATGETGSTSTSSLATCERARSARSSIVRTVTCESSSSTEGWIVDPWVSGVGSSLPIINSAKAGSTIPVKFSLGGDRGLAIFATGYPKATKIPCITGEPVDTVEEVVTSASGLIYDPLTDRYVYNWKTPKSYAGSCYRLDVRFTDGSTFTASFVFNK